MRDFSVPMSRSSSQYRRLRLVLFVCALGLICVAIVLAALHKTPWAIPAAEKERKNPLTVSVTHLAVAKQIFGEKCSNCHGDAGKGDGSEAMMYDPAPSDLTDSAKMNKLTDGEIYYQITEGRKPMPSFKKKLTDEQRWQLVLLVRSFANSTPSATPTGNPVLPSKP
jgi:mono/diheme cytochrome c family protein